MNRSEAFEMIQKSVKNKNLIKHMLACEACMRKMADVFNKDKDDWGKAGLLHDLDYDSTFDKPEKHGYITFELLKEKGVKQEILDAILAHPGHKERETLIEKTLYAVDPLTGLIVAAVLMHPDKKIGSVDFDFVKRRFNEKRFAAGADREQIRSIKDSGIDLDDFILYCLNAMNEISEDLGL